MSTSEAQGTRREEVSARNRIILAVLRQSVGWRNTPAFAVLFTLAEHCDGQGRCFPFIDTIAERTGLSRRTTERALSDLRKRGLVESRLRGRARGNEYWLRARALKGTCR